MKSIALIFLYLLSLTGSFASSKTSYSNNQDSAITAIGLTEKYFWIGTAHGLFRIQISNGKCTHYTTDNSKLPSNQIHAIAVQADGNLWVGTSKGILRYDNFVFYTLSTENTKLLGQDVRSLAVDKRQNVWILSDRKTMLVYNEHQRLLPVPAVLTDTDSIVQLLPCGDGTIATINSKNTCSFLQYHESKWLRNTNAGLNIKTEIRCTQWISTVQGNIFVFHPDSAIQNTSIATLDLSNRTWLLGAADGARALNPSASQNPLPSEMWTTYICQDLNNFVCLKGHRLCIRLKPI